MPNGKKTQRDMLVEIHTTLHGTEGRGGMVNLIENHDKRIRKVENRFIWLNGIWVGITGVIGSIAWWIKKGG